MPSYHPSRPPKEEEEKATKNTHKKSNVILRKSSYLIVCVFGGRGLGWRSGKIKSLNTWERQNDKMINYSICSVCGIYIMLGIRCVFPFCCYISFSIRLLLLLVFCCLLSSMAAMSSSVCHEAGYFQCDSDEQNSTSKQKWATERVYERARQNELNVWCRIPRF